ncbi:MAG TPA: VOC family protein [Gemmatimonadales bacterium]|jgi:predicted 3-demethylubiquinone-9 3-methyltransferase (glyoxalase superfamily)|nr:VOC family protein [Gemmatimonadales bacterium]
MQKITPFLWFNDNAEEAMNFYCSVFKNAKVGRVSRYGDAGPGPKGSVMSATFELEGQEFFALNGGPQFSFTEAVSFFVRCESQAEVDYFWEKLLAGGGKPSQCGWLKDRFGLSWQIVPNRLGELLGDRDPNRAGAAMRAMLKMSKIVIADLENAAKSA